MAAGSVNAVVRVRDVLDALPPMHDRPPERRRPLRRMTRRAMYAVVIAAVLSACDAAPDSLSTAPASSSEPGSESSGPEPTSVAFDGEVGWIVETDPVSSDRDAADDPAIWVDRNDPSRSVIIGTSKKSDDGLLLYDLSGEQLDATGGSAMNNVDLRPSVTVGDRELVLVVASTIEGRSLEIFELDPATRSLTAVGARPVETGIRAAGVCLYMAPDGVVYTFAIAGNGDVQQWRIFEAADGIDAELVREMELESHAEGCVVDDEAGNLYVSEESRGVWRLPADPSAGDDRELVAGTGPDGHLMPDVEGLSIAAYPDGRRYLIVSSQGDDRFAVYDIGGSEGAPWIGSFTVTDENGTDPVSHTDGLEVTTLPLGEEPFDGGILVVQDDENEEPNGDEANQNFKVVPLRWVAEGLMAR